MILLLQTNNLLFWIIKWQEARYYLGVQAQQKIGVGRKQGKILVYKLNRRLVLAGSKVRSWCTNSRKDWCWQEAR